MTQHLSSTNTRNVTACGACLQVCFTDIDGNNKCVALAVAVLMTDHGMELLDALHIASAHGDVFLMLLFDTSLLSCSSRHIDFKLKLMQMFRHVVVLLALLIK